MKTFPSRIWRLGLGFTFLAALVSAPARAQEPCYNLQGKKAHSKPISQTAIVFEVSTASGGQSRLLVEEGGMAKLGDCQEGYMFVLVPLVKEKATGTVTFTVFELKQDEAGNESIRELEKLDAGPEAATTGTTPALRLRVLAIEEPKKQASD